LVPYLRNDNLGAGDLHKLITLDTPLKGSDLANQLIDEAGNPTRLGKDLQSALNTGEERCITCGAVFDLRVGSPPISRMRATTVPSHAIVGVGGNAAFRELGSLALPFLPVLDTGASFLFTASTTLLGLDAFFFGSFRHDLIVSEESQRGSLTGNAV